MKFSGKISSSVLATVFGLGMTSSGLASAQNGVVVPASVNSESLAEGDNIIGDEIGGDSFAPAGEVRDEGNSADDVQNDSVTVKSLNSKEDLSVSSDVNRGKGRKSGINSDTSNKSAALALAKGAGTVAVASGTVGLSSVVTAKLGSNESQAAEMSEELKRLREQNIVLVNSNEELANEVLELKSNRNKNKNQKWWQNPLCVVFLVYVFLVIVHTITYLRFMYKVIGQFNKAIEDSKEKEKIETYTKVKRIFIARCIGDIFSLGFAEAMRIRRSFLSDDKAVDYASALVGDYERRMQSIGYGEGNEEEDVYDKNDTTNFKADGLENIENL